MKPVLVAPPQVSPQARHARRWWAPLLPAQALLLALNAGGPAAAQAREGVDVGKNSAFSNLVPADQAEISSAEQYAEMLQQASEQGALAGKEHPQLKRLRAIAAKIIPHALQWNPRAAN